VVILYLSPVFNCFDHVDHEKMPGTKNLPTPAVLAGTFFLHAQGGYFMPCIDQCRGQVFELAGKVLMNK
jgi:hypothetical protein